MIDWSDPESHPYFPLDPRYFPGAIINCYACQKPVSDHPKTVADFLAEDEKLGVLKRLPEYFRPDRLLPFDQEILTELAKLGNPFSWQDVKRMLGGEPGSTPKEVKIASIQGEAVLGKLINAGCIKIIERGSYAVVQKGPR